MAKKKYQDLTGKRFGRLEVLRLHGRDKYGKYKWLCRCDCGNSKITDTGQLNSGMTQSCGCIHKEQLIERNKSHGMAKTPIYNVWSSMKRRCNSETDNAYKNYGGRGISVCDKWKSFEGFYEDMGNTYKKGLTIERIDVNGNYCKANCMWIAREEQAKNTRRNRFVKYKGKTQIVSEWARQYDIEPNVLNARLKRGWSVEKALTTPIKNRK